MYKLAAVGENEVDFTSGTVLSSIYRKTNWRISKFVGWNLTLILTWSC